MTGSTRSSQGLSGRQKRLLFRSWHRGIRETDLLLGRFADAWVDKLSDEEMHHFEKLLQVPDHDLYAWVTGERTIPEAYQTGLMVRLQQHHAEGESGR